MEIVKLCTVTTIGMRALEKLPKPGDNLTSAGVPYRVVAVEDGETVGDTKLKVIYVEHT